MLSVFKKNVRARQRSDRGEVSAWGQVENFDDVGKVFSKSLSDSGCQYLCGRERRYSSPSISSLGKCLLRRGDLVRGRVAPLLPRSPQVPMMVGRVRRIPVKVERTCAAGPGSCGRCFIRLASGFGISPPVHIFVAHCIQLSAELRAFGFCRCGCGRPVAASSRRHQSSMYQESNAALRAKDDHPALTSSTHRQIGSRGRSCQKSPETLCGKRPRTGSHPAPLYRAKVYPTGGLVRGLGIWDA